MTVSLAVRAVHQRVGAELLDHLDRPGQQRAARGRRAQVLGPDADRRPRGPLSTRTRDACTVPPPSSATRAVAVGLARQEVHRRRADEAGDEGASAGFS